ncbi:MAG: 3-deoxy-D-manno-octulosonic acid transferase [Chitinophagaceae bacterium]|nr:3-deoxy-D-manno-octulosonic acid transferase [Chitinophagaceae bacterium]
MSLLYHLGIYLYSALLFVLAIFGHKKARLWVNGRKNWQARLQEKFKNVSSCVWFHCASLGEYELSVPLIETLKKQYPDKKILVTFFSPSGYEVKKNDTTAFHIDYLPVDSAYNARVFIDIVKPETVLFAKYDFWYYYLNILHRKKIPTYVFSATFRASQVFFQSYGGWYKQMLGCFTQLFVTNEESKQLLQQAGIHNVLVTGDNRYDRVFSTAKQNRIFPLIEKFKAGHQLLIAGSTWPEDEVVLADLIHTNVTSLKYVIAPHEIDAAHLQQLEQKLTVKSIRYSLLNEQTVLDDITVIIIDNIGMLSSLYKYGNIAYVGGAFKQGLHNILEPLSFGLPVLFGPHYKKFPEAFDFIACGGAFSIDNSMLLYNKVSELLSADVQKNIKLINAAEVAKHIGATEKIMNFISWKN